MRWDKDGMRWLGGGGKGKGRDGGDGGDGGEGKDRRKGWDGIE